MAGQAVVNIGDHLWTVDLATTPVELTQGLGGIPSIPEGTGMLFDLGQDRIIQVTTETMLFPIDIIWIHSAQGVVEVARDIAPGYLVTPAAAARFFLEVNAGEAAEVGVGDSAAIDVTATPAEMQWTHLVRAIAGPLVAIGVLGLMIGGIAVMPTLPKEAYDDLLFREYIRDMVRLGEPVTDETARLEWELWKKKRGTGEITSGERRYGSPRTEAERRERHESLYGTEAPTKGEGRMVLHHSPGFTLEELMEMEKYLDLGGKLARSVRGYFGGEEG